MATNDQGWQEQETDVCMYKGIASGDSYGYGIVLCVDCGGDYTYLHTLY